MCDFLQSPNATLVWDNEQSVPFAYKGDQWVGFDDERSFKAKVEWLKEGSFGGVMIWSMDLDDFTNHCRTGKYPLVNSIVSELEGYKVKLEYQGPHEGTAGGSKAAKKDRKPSDNTCRVMTYLTKHAIVPTIIVPTVITPTT